MTRPLVILTKVRIQFVLVATLALLLAACGSKPIAQGPAIAPEPAPHTYVAIGASESVGIGADSVLRDGWTKVFWTGALPKGTVFNNLANSGSVANQAATQQLPNALAAKPDYVTVWLNVNDIIAGISVSDYKKAMAQILTSLHDNTKARVLVANVPPLDQMPAYLAARNGDTPNGSPFRDRAVPTPDVLNATIDAYNSTIAQLVKDNGDTLVDLHALGPVAPALYAADGFHPSTLGHAAIGQAFITAFKQ